MSDVTTIFNFVQKCRVQCLSKTKSMKWENAQRVFRQEFFTIQPSTKLEINEDFRIQTLAMETTNLTKSTMQRRPIYNFFDLNRISTSKPQKVSETCRSSKIF